MLLGFELNVPAVEAILAPVGDHLARSETAFRFAWQAVTGSKAVNALDGCGNFKVHQLERYRLFRPIIASVLSEELGVGVAQNNRAVIEEALELGWLLIKQLGCHLAGKDDSVFVSAQAGQP